VEPPIIVISATPPFRGTWTSAAQLRIGRLPELEVFINDASISRRHSEFVLDEGGWVIRDFGSTNGTELNGVRIGRTPQRVRVGDTVRIGEITFKIELLRGKPIPTVPTNGPPVHVEAASRRTWNEAVDGFELSDDRWQRDGKAFLRLMRAGYRLAHSKNPDEQLQRVLDDAVSFFGAQRGGIFLADSPAAALAVRCVSLAPNSSALGRNLSRTPANRAYAGQQSLLYRDCRESSEFLDCGSVKSSAMSSIICAVLRSPDRTFGVLHLDRGHLQEAFNESDLYLADSLTAALALGVERLQMVDRQQELFLHTVTALSQAVEMRDRYTANHTNRVIVYSLVLAEEIGLTVEERQLLRAAAALHDIGKIAIDDQILRKPGRLSDAEFAKMKTHVTRGAEIIEMVPGLAWALPVVRGHHERWDGTGYPDRLKGEAIPLLARVVAVADAFDAMTSDRPYRSGMPTGAAYAELVAGSGKQFDPSCVAGFVRARPRIEALLDQERELQQRAETETATISGREFRRLLALETPPPDRFSAPTSVLNPAIQNTASADATT
jgi:HD-GYP domain-containing protein (c-di-GMP phosphodiesterase class II)